MATHCSESANRTQSNRTEPSAERTRAKQTDLARRTLICIRHLLPGAYNYPSSSASKLNCEVLLLLLNLALSQLGCSLNFSWSVVCVTKAARGKGNTLEVSLKSDTCCTHTLFLNPFTLLFSICLALLVCHCSSEPTA